MMKYGDHISVYFMNNMFWRNFNRKKLALILLQFNEDFSLYQRYKEKYSKCNLYTIECVLIRVQSQAMLLLLLPSFKEPHGYLNIKE